MHNAPCLRVKFWLVLLVGDQCLAPYHKKPLRRTGFLFIHHTQKPLKRQPMPAPCARRNREWLSHKWPRGLVGGTNSCPHHWGGTRFHPSRIRLCQSCSALKRTMRRECRTRALPLGVTSASVTSTYLAWSVSPALVMRTTCEQSGERSQPTPSRPWRFCSGLLMPHMPAVMPPADGALWKPPIELRPLPPPTRTHPRESLLAPG